MTTHRLAELSTAQIARLDKTDAVAVQPIGAIEQHGAHLPVITDALTAEAISDRAIAALGPDSNVWMLPTLSYGKSTEHLGRAGTIAMSAATLISVCMDLGRSLAASGFRKLVFVNGHGGQPNLLDMVARDIRVETGLEVFPLMPGRFPLPEGIEPADPHYGIHGGHIETSIVWSLRPDLVQMEHAVKDGHVLGEIYAGMRHLTLEGAVPTAWVTDDVSASGTIGDPTAATREVGDKIVESQVATLAEVLTEIRAFSFPEVALPEVR
ncbi:creatininase family protein [Microbacterium sp. ZXX196]|uniref:creatininase family protein n=1 Tax=Microbacterium sp. ZXX196 TaxID=2609291 RepID=UPI0012B6CDA9|nr:creatininase family protein [Microbacterium sp. ZXX196]MTE24582.1 creatininase family protein [Microbacterium sp. ZXX196]